MAKGYRPVDRDQPFLLPPDMRQWLPEGHAVWLVIEAVRLLDTRAFHVRRRTGGAGAAGYDPDMMVTLLIWAYANGVTSSRRIERLCGQDVAFRVICAGHQPDHVTVARFRQQFAGTAADLFAQVLLLCARLGMGQVGTVAVDGTKIAADASKDETRTEAGLRRLAADLAARHAQADADEDAASGKGRRRDDDPGDPRTRAGRVAAALAGLEAERAARQEAERRAAQPHLDTLRAGDVPGRGRPPAGAGAETARAALEREVAACLATNEDYERRRAAGLRVTRPPVPPERSARVRRAQARLQAALAREGARAKQGRPEQGTGQPGQGKKKEPARRNVTDPDSRLMPVRGGGFIQGYNAQNVTTEDGLVLATRLTADTADTRWYQPVTAAAQAAAADMAAAAGETGPGIGLVLADAGYLSEANLAAPGPDRLIATGKKRDLERRARAGGNDRAGEDSAGGGPLTAAMAARLTTQDGIAAYRRRGHIGETFHGDLKHNQQFRRLSVRGLPRASGEWTFAAAVRNLRKAITSGHLTQASLAALAA
jgi:transposase